MTEEHRKALATKQLEIDRLTTENETIRNNHPTTLSSSANIYRPETHMRAWTRGHPPGL